MTTRKVPENTVFATFIDPKGGRYARTREWKAGKRERAPTHPGKIIKTAIEALPGRVTMRQAAIAMGTTSQMLGLIIAEKAGVSSETALRLGKYFGNGPELWLGLQGDYDLWHARVAMKAKLAKVKPAKAA